MKTTNPFIPEREYKRREIHNEFGGNPQSGISPSSKFPFIFIFTGKTGEQHGYLDDWLNSEVFAYTGEGQVGDMQLNKGNLAIRNHIVNKKRIFLFEATRKSYVKFIAEMSFLEMEEFIAPDRNLKPRKAIRFKLGKISSLIPYEFKENISKFQEPDEPFILPDQTERSGLVTSRIGHGAYRNRVIKRWNNRCAVTGFNDPRILIASHIHPWKNATDFERLDVHNGILLSPVYDALFDKYLITFNNSGKIQLSDKIKRSEYQKLGILGNEKIKDFSTENLKYLEMHNRIFYS